MVAPIRSARLINTQLSQQYNAALVNSGGSDGVRWELSQLPIVNLDEYFWPKPYFYRENQGWQTRLAVNILAAHQLMEAEDMSATVPLRGFTFSDGPPDGDPAQSVFIPYPQRTSPVDWRYDPNSGRYLRWISDQPMVEFAIIVNGEGRAQIFRDGVVMEGLWRTDGTQTPEFVFPNGEPIPLKRGNSWIEVVPTDFEILVQ
jgi:hypothetical protein